MRKVLLRDINAKNVDGNKESENRSNNHYDNGNGNGNNDDNNDNYNHNNISSESQEDINVIVNSNSVSYTSTKYKLSNPRNGEFHSILETVKDAVQKEAPKLIFSVCQALGSVGFVFLIEYARCEKSKISNCVLETNLSINNNVNNTSGINDKFQYHNFVNNDNEIHVNRKDMKNGDNNMSITNTNQSVNINNNLPVLDLMLNNQNRCQSCVSKITSILIAMLRHGAVKVSKGEEVVIMQ